MKRALAIVGVLLLALAVYRGMGGFAERPPPLPASPPTVRVERERVSPPVPVEPPPTGATLSGRVVRRAAGVEAARVVARCDGGTFEVRSAADGTFRFDALVPGRCLISASLNAEASRMVGPLWVRSADPAPEPLMLELLPAGSVSGTVYDARSRRPIARAKVVSSGGSASTDHAGRFFLGSLPAGATWLEASAEGFVSRTEWLTLESARALSGLELSLRPAALIRGSVQRLGTPVSGATLWAERAELGAGGFSTTSVQSASDGSFELRVEAGTVQLAVATRGGSRVEGPRLTLAEGATREGIVVELGEALAAEGVVRVDGTPTAGAQLLLIDGRSQRASGMSSSREGGRFRFEGLAPGSYLVQVSLEGIQSQRGPFELRGDGTDTWDVDIQKGRTLSGRVVPEVSGALVRWRSTEWAGDTAAQVSTDSKGRFHFDAVADGALVVEAESPAGSARTRARAGEAVVLTLRPSVLRGAVVNERGHAISDFTVRLKPADGGPSRAYPVLNPTGEFKLDAPPGRYSVSATAEGHGEAEQSAAVEVGQGEPFVKLTLLGAVAVRGIVRDVDTQAPLAGVELTFNRMGRNRQRWAGRWATTVTGADGTFELGAVPIDAVLATRRAGYAPLWAALEAIPKDPSGRRVVSLKGGSPESGQGFQPYEGIGAQLAEDAGGALVALTFEGGPAEAAGLLPGDRIVAVDGQPTRGMKLPEVVRRIMGPAGSVVGLSLQRSAERLDVQVRRRSIQF